MIVSNALAFCFNHEIMLDEEQLIVISSPDSDINKIQVVRMDYLYFVRSDTRGNASAVTNDNSDLVHSCSQPATKRSTGPFLPNHRFGAACRGFVPSSRLKQNTDSPYGLSVFWSECTV